jgi:hypothetical protein
MDNLEESKKLIASVLNPQIVKLNGRLIVGEHDRDRPSLVSYVPRFGLFAMEVQSSIETEFDAGRRLSSKVFDLRSAFPESEKLRITQVVVSFSQPKMDKIGASTLIFGINEINVNELTSSVASQEESSEQYLNFVDRLHPAIAFQAVVRKPVGELEISDRRLIRLALDLEQIEGVTREVKDVLHIKGPPGSGKTLMLIARARLLSEKFPDWSIQIVTYNRTLCGYLEAELGHYENIKVSTFFEFTRDRLQTFYPSDSDATDRFESVKKLGIKRNIDALLIDEWQDFHQSWIRYCLETLKPGRGGLVLAGDVKQALYRSSLPIAALEGRNVEVFELKRPYRSTRQILELVSRLDSDFSTEGVELAPDGQPINLVFAPTLHSQAEFVAWQINSILKSGVRKARDIGVIGATWKSVEKVQAELEKLGIDCLQVGGGNGGDSPQWGFVTVTTVHSAKGYEFDVVFLLAIESLPESKNNEDELSRRRIAYVGPTRAKDELFITYTKQNRFLKVMHSMPKEFVQPWTWPDDYEV